MNYQVIDPCPNLADYVRCFWVLESDQPYLHRAVADGCAEMVFHYKGTFDEITPDNKIEKSWASGIQAQSQTFRRFITKESFGIFGVYLYPFAIPQLFSVPACEVSNEMPDLATFLGADGKFLEERMMLAGNTQQRVQIITKYLEGRLIKSRSPLPMAAAAIRHVIKMKGAVRIEDLAGEYFLSVRQFERNFKILSGFSPKLFSRIIRFQSAIKEYEKSDSSLTEIAYACGYYDQSHFIEDFKKFSGHNPREYFSVKTLVS